MYIEDNYVNIYPESPLSYTFIFSVGILFTSPLAYDFPVVIRNNVFNNSPVVNENIMVSASTNLRVPIIVANNSFIGMYLEKGLKNGLININAPDNDAIVSNNSFS